jgi:hypothetical protein
MDEKKNVLEKIQHDWNMTENVLEAAKSIWDDMNAFVGDYRADSFGNHSPCSACQIYPVCFNKSFR